MKILSKSLKDTEEIAKEFLGKISAGIYGGALVVGLYGDLGAGKTTFVQDIAKIFGIKDFVTSPTYVIEKMYSLNSLKSEVESLKKFDRMIHIDLYRIESEKELIDLHWQEIASDSKNIILIEWPERVAEVLPKNHAKVYFKFISDTEREIEI